MTAILNGKVDMDLNAARAAAAREATHKQFRFTFSPPDGQPTTFTVPPMMDWPMEVEMKLAEGQLSGAIGMLLGDQMDAFIACKPTFGDLRLLLEQVGTWAGVDGLGNSGPPQRPASNLT